MKIEHLALNVPDALSLARWYVEHLGLTVKRRMMEEPWAHFLVDDSGTVMLELYTNKTVAMPDYANLEAANLHLAFVSADLQADLLRLSRAGATTPEQTEVMPNGDEVAMFRDPWNIPLQLVKRVKPMI